MSLSTRLSPFKTFSRKGILALISRNFGGEDTCTHTGQKWEKNDYRLVRFINCEKQVNPHFAESLIAAIPPKQVTERVVWCDGGSGPEGHPRVYINLDKPGNHTCGYCGLRYVKATSH